MKRKQRRMIPSMLLLMIDLERDRCMSMECYHIVRVNQAGRSIISIDHGNFRCCSSLKIIYNSLKNLELRRKEKALETD